MLYEPDFHNAKKTHIDTHLVRNFGSTFVFERSALYVRGIVKIGFRVFVLLNVFTEMNVCVCGGG